MTIGERIRRRRLELGMTQEELASKLGYKSKASINKIELGIQDLPQKKIVDFAQALDASSSYLMGWSDNATVYNASAEEQEVFDAYHKLSIKEKNMIRRALGLKPIEL